jgi:hypothetical protein
MKVRIINQPSGLLNAKPWPEAGETIDLPTVVAEGMAAAGDVEIVKAAPAKKAAEKPAEKVESRPAAKADVETRKKA